MRHFHRVFFALFSFCSALGAKPFVVGHLQYELGNQMFQIAATIAYALDHDLDPYFPCLDECTWWDIPLNRDYVFSRLNPDFPPEAIEVFFKDDGRIPIPKYENVKLQGLFQSERFFAHHKDAVIEAFAPTQEILDYLNATYPEILSHPCSVGLHVRTYLKDYGHLPTIDDVHFFTGVEYYENAVKKFPADALFVVCSDRIDWCKENLAHLAPNIIFIENSKHYHDFYLLSLCKHIITANSTFSWWAAYLNSNPDKMVVTPSSWFGQWFDGSTDKIVPKDWIRVPRGKR